jgi:chemotaxis protein MotB
MARHLIALAASGLFLTGCVGQDKYNALRLEKDQLVEQLGQAQTEAERARAAEQAWKQQHDALIAGMNDKDRNALLEAQKAAEWRAQFEAMKAKYEDALGKQQTFAINLPETVKNELSKLAEQYPDAVEFDAVRGVLKFKSDVTFAKGSAELTPQGKQIVGKAADILNSQAVRNYEFLVAGHTDSTPVSNPATIKAGHHDNWYLSSHRAIAVGKELMNHQISPRRVGMVGYGAERPVASNASSDGQAKNRRVEIAILPTTYSGGNQLAGGNANKAPGSGAAPRSTAAPDLNKDASTGALLNK